MRDKALGQRGNETEEERKKERGGGKAYKTEAKNGSKYICISN